MKLLRPIRNSLAYLAGRPRAVDITQAVNEESFWDFYVRKWEESPVDNGAKYVGTEWKYEDEFVGLLRKYASPDQEALEVGCGGGRITATGVTLFKHVYAADLSAEMLRKSKQALEGSAVSFHKLDGFTLDAFADSSLDFVYSHDVLVQLSSMQIYPYFIEMARVLKPGGMGLASCYDFTDRFDLFKETSLRLWNRRQFPVVRRLHFMTEEMLRTMLTGLLTVVEVHRGRFLTVAFRK